MLSRGCSVFIRVQVYRVSQIVKIRIKYYLSIICGLKLPKSNTTFNKFICAEFCPFFSKIMLHFHLS